MPESIITGIFTLLGIIIGSFIGYMTAIRISDRKEFQKAALDFHDAFLDSLMSLDDRYHREENTETNVCTILSRDFAKQVRAMLRFQIFLSADQRKVFDKAWHEYCHYDVNGGPSFPFLEQYFEDSLDGQPTNKLALSRIRKLMTFVESANKSHFDIKRKS